MKSDIIRFECDGHDFPMDIIDRDGERWVTRKQLAEALGVQDLDSLHRRLSGRGELREDIHWNRFTVDTKVNPKGGRPDIIIYSYRGIIRVSMASEGKNAIAFRDWAETVLYYVMRHGHHTTGGDFDSETTAIHAELEAYRTAESLMDTARTEARRVLSGEREISELGRFPMISAEVGKLITNMPKKLLSDGGEQAMLLSCFERLMSAWQKDTDILKGFDFNEGAGSVEKGRIMQFRIKSGTAMLLNAFKSVCPDILEKLEICTTAGLGHKIGQATEFMEARGWKLKPTKMRLLKRGRKLPERSVVTGRIITFERKTI